MLSDSTDMKCSEQANPYRQKADWWLRGEEVGGEEGEDKEVIVQGTEFFLRG